MVNLFAPAFRTIVPPAEQSRGTMRFAAAAFLLVLAGYVLFRIFENDLTRLVIPLFPDEADKSFVFYKDLLRLAVHEVLWFIAFVAVTAFLINAKSGSRIFTRFEMALLAKPSAAAACIIGTSFLATLVVAQSTLQGFPNSADEYAYLIQAETLSEGKLWQEGHVLPGFFSFNHIAQKDGISISRFPPGWPLVLSLGFVLNIPAFMVNPLLGMLSLVLLFAFASRYYDRRIAMWSLASMAFVSFFIFNAASYFSHTSCMLFTLAFVFCLYRYLEQRSIVWALLAGLSLALIAITRYYTAVLVFLPVVVFLVYHQKLKSIQTFWWIGLGSLPAIGVLFWYNYTITGNALLPVTVWTNSNEALGFVQGHTFMKGVEHSVRRVLLFLYWGTPALLILYAYFLIRKVSNGLQTTRPEDYFFVLLLAGYFFYYHLGGNQYGPRFIFEALPFVIVFVVSCALSAGRRWATAMLLAGLLTGIVRFPFIAVREHRVVTERKDLYTQVEQQKIANAVVFISGHTGTLRPMPPSDLTRNGLRHDRDVIYAIDRGEENAALMQFYPSRAYYRYVRDREKPSGELLKIN